MDDNEDLWESRLYAEGGLDPMRLNMQFARTQMLRDENIFHPAIADFGPSSLAHFLRSEIDKAIADGRLGKGNGKEAVRSASRSQDDGTKQQKRPATATADPNSKSDTDDINQQPAAPTSLTLAKDALLHLRGFKSKEDAPQASVPAAPKMSLDSASPYNNNNDLPVRIVDPCENRRNQARLRDERIRRPNSAATDRSSEFARHTQQVRYVGQLPHPQTWAGLVRFIRVCKRFRTLDSPCAPARNPAPVASRQSVHRRTFILHTEG